MAVSLYDATVPSYEQTIAAIEGVLGKGLSFCQEQGIEPAELGETRLQDDMLPLHFQIVSVVHHNATDPAHATLNRNGRPLVFFTHRSMPRSAAACVQS